MKILILGAGKMGSFFTDLLSFDHEVAVLEQDPKRMRFIYNALRMQSVDEIDAFAPEMVINCVTLTHTLDAFRSVLPHLRPYCIIFRHRIGENQPAGVLQRLRFSVRLYPPDVRADLCEPW